MAASPITKVSLSSLKLLEKDRAIVSLELSLGIFDELPSPAKPTSTWAVVPKILFVPA